MYVKYLEYKLTYNKLSISVISSVTIIIIIIIIIMCVQRLFERTLRNQKTYHLWEGNLGGWRREGGERDFTVFHLWPFEFCMYTI